MKSGTIVGCLLWAASVLFGQQQGVDLRRQLAGIDYRRATNIDDYLSRCKKVNAVLPQLEDFHNHASETIRRLKRENASDAHFLQVADFYASINEQDRAGLELLRREMKLASQMSALASTKRQKFFDSQILPLQHQEDQVVAQEVQMAIKAKKDGLALPQDVVDSVASKR
jgi:hypothetical protein